MIQNKTIVITGASSGIGYEVMKRLAADGTNQILAVARRVDKLVGMAPNITPFSADLSTKEGIDATFSRACELFGKADIFIANAGAPYYELYDYIDWERVERIFRLNTIGPIYTYAKYLHHLNGMPGHLVYTVSAMGEMAMPGYALYGATKFAVNGFQQAIRLEKPQNMKLTCVYPVSTLTNFASVAGAGEAVELPSPVQSAEEVADAMVKGIEKGKESIYPCKIYPPSKAVFTISKTARTSYWKSEGEKFRRYIESKNNK